MFATLTPPTTTAPGRKRIPVRAVEPVRLDRVARLRREIALGRYPAPGMLDRALDRMIDEVLSSMPS
jgi:hypothetical protein